MKNFFLSQYFQSLSYLHIIFQSLLEIPLLKKLIEISILLSQTFIKKFIQLKDLSTFLKVYTIHQNIEKSRMIIERKSDRNRVIQLLLVLIIDFDQLPHQFLLSHSDLINFRMGSFI